MIKILIADDERFEREMLEEIVVSRLSREAECRMVENGREAVGTAALWGADMVLMDIEMPGINGIEAARQILQQRSDCKIIFITAYSLFNYAHEAVKLGACDYILKPVKPEDVERAIRQAISQIEAHRQLEEMAAAGAALEEEEPHDKATLLMAKVKKYLQHNYMMYDISLDSVSAILNISASYFSVQFKKNFGVNFVDYLADLRIQAAKELLKDPLRPASEVAAMVGYESPNYFARAFKKKTGMTPTEYRKYDAKSREGGPL